MKKKLTKKQKSALAIVAHEALHDMLGHLLGVEEPALGKTKALKKALKTLKGVNVASYALGHSDPCDIKGLPDINTTRIIFKTPRFWEVQNRIDADIPATFNGWGD